MASRQRLAVTPELQSYILAHGHNDDPLLQDLAAETAALGRISQMQVAPEQGTFLTIMVRALGVRHALEVGTFTGYSSICIARGLVEGGHLTCCDVSEKYTEIARRYWERAGLVSRVTLKLAPALETLRALPDQPIDFVFIDADKTNYLGYYEECLRRLKANGLIVIDNVLWSGQVINSEDQSPDTVALRQLNDHIAADRRVDAVMVPIADGLTIVRKK